MDRPSRSLINALIEVFREFHLDISNVLWGMVENTGLWELYQDIRQQMINQILPVRTPSVGYRRSLVRRIASSLPMKAPSRVYIQILPLCKRLPVIEKNNEPVNDVFQGLGEIGWLDGDAGDSRVLARGQCNMEARHPVASRGMESNLSRYEPRTSTPIGASSSGFYSLSEASVAPDTALRIMALEDELAALKAAIAGIVMNREQGKLNTIVEEVTQGSGDNYPCSGQGPPPPPPLPPPTMFCQNPLSQLKLQVTKAKESSTGGPVVSKPQTDMAAVLKGLGSVKLRPVQRSPGGTPLRSRSQLPPDPSDPAALLAAALRKRFQSIACESPEKDGDWSSGFNSSNEFASPTLRSSVSRPVARRISLAGT